MLPFKPWLCSREERRCISNFLFTRNCQHNLLAGARTAEKRTKGRACGGGGGKNISAVKHSSAVTRGVGDNRRWEGRGQEHSDTALQEVFAPGVLVQSEVHHFWGRGPVLLGSHCCPWLRGVGAPERRAALPGGHALDHPSPGMHAPAARRGTRTQRQGHLSSAQPRDPPPPVFLSLSG